MKALMIWLVAVLVGTAAVAADFRVLSANEAVAVGATHEVTLTWADLAATTEAAGTYTNVAIFPVAANQAVEAVGMKLLTAFSTPNDATATNSITLAVGDGTDTDRFFAATQIASDDTEVMYQFPLASFVTVTNTVTAPTHRKLYTSADTVDFLFTPGATTILGSNSAGRVVVYFNVR